MAYSDVEIGNKYNNYLSSNPHYITHILEQINPNMHKLIVRRKCSITEYVLFMYKTRTIGGYIITTYIFKPAVRIDGKNYDYIYVKHIGTTPIYNLDFVIENIQVYFNKKSLFYAIYDKKYKMWNYDYCDLSLAFIVE